MPQTVKVNFSQTSNFQTAIKHTVSEIRGIKRLARSIHKYKFVGYVLFSGFCNPARFGCGNFPRQFFRKRHAPNTAGFRGFETTGFINAARDRDVLFQQQALTKDEAIAAMNSGNNYSAKNPEEKFGVRVQDKKGCWTCPAATHKVIGVAYIFSPRGWIALQSVEATKQYKPMKPEDLTDDMLRPVLRIMAPSKSLGNLAKVGPYMSESHKQKVIGGYSVTRVVVPNKNKTTVLQPTKEIPITEESQNLMGAKFEETGLLAEFNIDEIKKLAATESELYVTIVKTDGDEARCKIKSSDLVDYLNMEIL